MTDSGEYFDVIIVGGGIMGSCAAYEVAKRGRRPLLLEQFDFLHHLGSSHGESRTIRSTYPEPYYPPMVLESSKLWEEAQSEIGYRVLTPTPQFDIGPASSLSLRSAIANSRPAPQLLDGPRASKLFSGAFTLPENWVGVVSDGGVIKPTKSVAMFQTLAMRKGAVLKDRTKVTAIETGELGVRVLTKSGDGFTGRRCIVTVGGWTRELVKRVSGVELPIKPLHTVICYWKIKEEHAAGFSIENGFPTFASYGEPSIYGTPSMEFPGLVKVAMHGGRPCDPDKREWGSAGVLVESAREWIEGVMGGRVEVEGGPAMTQSCMYSMTPDGDFVIDFLGEGKEVVVAGGFSGHGFKMGPVVGRILAEMAIDGEAKGVEMGYFRIGRFEDDPKGNAKEYQDRVSPHLNPFQELDV